MRSSCCSWVLAAAALGCGSPAPTPVAPITVGSAALPPASAPPPSPLPPAVEASVVALPSAPLCRFDVTVPAGRQGLKRALYAKVYATFTNAHPKVSAAMTTGGALFIEMTLDDLVLRGYFGGAAVWLGRPLALGGVLSWTPGAAPNLDRTGDQLTATFTDIEGAAVTGLASKLIPITCDDLTVTRAEVVFPPLAKRYLRVKQNTDLPVAEAETGAAGATVHFAADAVVAVLAEHAGKSRVAFDFGSQTHVAGWVPSTLLQPIAAPVALAEAEAARETARDLEERISGVSERYAAESARTRPPPADVPSTMVPFTARCDLPLYTTEGGPRIVGAVRKGAQIHAGTAEDGLVPIVADDAEVRFAGPIALSARDIAICQRGENTN